MIFMTLPYCDSYFSINGQDEHVMSFMYQDRVTVKEPSICVFVTPGLPPSLLQEAAQALIYAGMAGSKLEGIQDKVNEYLDRVQALHNAGKFTQKRCAS